MTSESKDEQNELTLDEFGNHVVDACDKTLQLQADMSVDDIEQFQQELDEFGNLVASTRDETPPLSADCSVATRVLISQADLSVDDEQREFNESGNLVRRNLAISSTATRLLILKADLSVDDEQREFNESGDLVTSTRDETPLPTADCRATPPARDEILPPARDETLPPAPDETPQPAADHPGTLPVVISQAHLSVDVEQHQQEFDESGDLVTSTRDETPPLTADCHPALPTHDEMPPVSDHRDTSSACDETPRSARVEAPQPTADHRTEPSAHDEASPPARVEIPRPACDETPRTALVETMSPARDNTMSVCNETLPLACDETPPPSADRFAARPMMISQADLSATIRTAMQPLSNNLDAMQAQQKKTQEQLDELTPGGRHPFDELPAIKTTGLKVATAGVNTKQGNSANWTARPTRRADLEIGRIHRCLDETNSNMRLVTSSALELTEILAETRKSPITTRSMRDLFTLTQSMGEPLRSFIHRFKSTLSDLGETPDSMSLEALRHGLWYKSKFKEALILQTCSTLDDALHLAQQYILLEEDDNCNAKHLGKVKSAIAMPEEEDPESLQQTKADKRSLSCSVEKSVAKKPRNHWRRLNQTHSQQQLSSRQDVVDVVSSDVERHAKGNSLNSPSWPASNLAKGSESIAAQLINIEYHGKIDSKATYFNAATNGSDAASQTLQNTVREIDPGVTKLRRELSLISSRANRIASSARGIAEILAETRKSPLTPRLAAIPLKDQITLRLELFNGRDDPKSWLTTFEIAMKRQKYASPEERDANFCQIFAEHLDKEASIWFSNLPAESIDSFDDLATIFLKQYSTFMSKSCTNLFALTQERHEPLRKFIDRFRVAATEHHNLSDEMAVKALECGLWFESEFKASLMLDEPKSLADALYRSSRYIYLEEAYACNSAKYYS